LAIYDTPEAANKAINASPLTISFPPGHLPPPPLASPHAESTATEEDNDGQPSSIIICKIVYSIKTRAEHEKIIHGNQFSDDQNKLNGISDNPRIADVFAAGVPRREFADCLSDDLLFKSGQVNDQVKKQSEEQFERQAEGQINRELAKKNKEIREKRQAEFIAKGSLIALLDK